MRNPNSKQTQPTAAVVDDDVTQLKVLSGLLKKAGIAATTWPSAEAALAGMSSDTPPDIIITDLYMPDIDGWRFCRLLRSPEYSAFNRVPVLVVSATFSGDEAARITADIGADAFLPVPVDGPTFIARVRALLAGEAPKYRPRALIIDDSRSTAGLLKETFETHGYSADVALTVGQGRAALHAAAYDVTVIDYHLPDGPGDALLAECRTGQPDCIPMMITIDPRADLALAWMKAGAAGYLRKPFDPEYLIALCVKARRERSLLRVEGLLDERTRKLRESESRFRSFVENASDIVYGLTPEGVFTYVSPNWSEFMGEPAEAAVGRSFSPYVHPEDVHLCREFLERVLSTGERRISVEYRVKRADGTIRWHTSKGSPLRNEAGEVVGYVGIARDVTEQKTAEAALRESEARYRSLTENFPDGALFLYDRELRFLVANGKGFGPAGLTSEAVVGRTVAEVFPDLWDLMRPYHEAGLRGEEGYYEVTLRGRLYSNHVVPVRDNAEVPEQAIVVVQDITDRRRAEEMLREQERRFRKFVEESSDIIVFIDETGYQRYISPSAERITGFTIDELRRPFAEVIHPDDVDRVIDAFQSLFGKPDGKAVVEYRHIHKNGGYCHFQAIGRNFMDDPLVAGVLVNVRDITDSVRMREEKARLEARFQQAQKLESVGRLAGGVAHDLNNLLTPILGYSEMLLMELHDEDHRKGSVGEILKAGERARSLVRQLLAFSRKQVLAVIPLDLNAVLTQFRKLLRRTIREDVEIRVTLAPSIPTVQGDVGQLEQVVMNLSVNAQDAMPDGGVLTIETAETVLDADYAATHEGAKPGRYVMMAVSDTGIGMDELTREHLFEPFFTTKAPDKGTGLGLATVYGIVKQHGGNIWVYSESGRGSTFKVYLPVSDLPAVTPESDAPQRPAERGTETVLLVEDNEGVRGMTEAMLRRQGFSVLSEGSPSTALSRLDRHDGPVDLLLTDVVMPEINGKQLYEAARVRRPGIRVLYMSGYTDEVIAHQGVIDPDVSFIQKPFSHKALVAKVRNVLDSD